MEKQINVALGTIIGAAVGDSLGAPLEFLPARDPDNFVTEMIGGGVLKWNPGDVTDDTIMSLCIQEMYLEKGRYNQGTIIKKWIKWLESNPKDIGSWTYDVLTIWKNTDSKHELRGNNNPAVRLWKSTGKKSAGNGALMRCMPSAIVHRKYNEFINDTIFLAEDTHPDPRCILSCIAVNNLIHIAFGDMNKDEALEDTIKLISTIGQYYLINEANEVINSLGDATDHEWEYWENSGYTIDTLKCAVAAWYQNESFEEGLIKVVNRGNDADTVGAVAGSLLGAYHGYDSIPSRWVDSLNMKQTLINNTMNLLKIETD
jgi:ADP-ribosyl-[dinitrogen reductase] hydrolase